MSEAPRPVSIDEFVGQKRAVQHAKIAIAAAKHQDRRFPHMIMGGPPGLGKTSLATVIANEMDGKIHTFLASNVKNYVDLIDMFHCIDSLNTFIFVDEIEQLPRKVTEILHTALEDNWISVEKNPKVVSPNVKGLPIPEFTFIAATNYMGELPKPFLDRFEIQTDFVLYTKEELIKILSNASKKLKIRITNKAVDLISSASKGTPRIGISLMRKNRDFVIAHKELWTEVKGVTIPLIKEETVLKCHEFLGVDQKGLKDIDRRILQALLISEGPIGLDTLSSMVNDHVSRIRLSEDYLLLMNLISRTPRGRIITKRGREHIKKFEEMQEEVVCFYE